MKTKTMSDYYTKPNDEVIDSPDRHGVHNNLTKREYFAAMAIQGIISNSGEGLQNPLITAPYAIKYADALIEELNKPKQ